MSKAVHPRSKATELRAYDFHGITVYLRFWHSPGSEIKKLIVSWRHPIPKKKSQKPYGETVLERTYALRTSSPVYNNDANLENIIADTLDHVMPKYFLPALFKNSDVTRAVLTGDLHLAAVFPYAWELDKKEKNYSPGTLPDKEAAYEKIMEKFQDVPTKKLSPNFVAPWLLNDVPLRIARNSVTLFRTLFNGVLKPVLPNLKTEWNKYSFSFFRSTYSPATQIRNRLYLAILNEPETKEIMSRCESHVKGVKNAAKYFVAATMLVTGITLDEACALSLDCFIPLTGYHEKYGLRITKRLERIGTPRKKGDGFIRENRYEIKDIDDLYSKRILPIGSWMTSLLNQMKQKGIDSQMLLLHHTNNKERAMHPEDFSAWLDTAFNNIITRKTIVIDKEIKDTRCVADYLTDTAPHMLKTYGYLTGEVRYQNALPPSNTDARYYIDFKSESSLVKMGLIQDLWLANIQHPTAETAAPTESIYQTVGHPHQVPSLRLRIKLPPQTQTDSPLLLKATGKFGFKGTMHVCPDTPSEN